MKRSAAAQWKGSLENGQGTLTIYQPIDETGTKRPCTV